ncbi:anti-sigma factor antagonist [Cryobacterium roopkundense]|uniref:Anti-sigma factor antagonist n=1 Tax=Cryobacterium roopkundense TaxID=1001240 RepID=A0A099JNF9_9MICO|nr:STAS domain-containing protein [Cryobacterium roopkundense]KGJ79670.1 anti-sigma factor antagonist [Cryobacterium roopkundense]MBB5642513.1 anti-sigma B factor antagonist [Cryobacterium roopkundense]
MEFSVKNLSGGVAVVQVDGRLNMVTAPRLREVVSASVAKGDIRVVVDLSKVTFIDSSGLGALISGLKTARQAGGDLRIAAPNEQVRLVLQLTNMERVLTSYPDSVSAYGS